MPEVETLARKLRKTVNGKKIVHISLSGLPLRKPVPGNFCKGLRGRTIRRILRRGKYLVIELEPRMFWLIHLGMSGRLFYHTEVFHSDRHTHKTPATLRATTNAPDDKPKEQTRGKRQANKRHSRRRKR